METKKFYSPKQIYVGTFLGGPVAGVYFVKKNFDEMLEQKASSLALLLGSLCVLGITILVFVLPENFPNTIIPILYSGLAAGAAWHFQVSKEEEEVNEEYGFISNWSVVKVALVSLVVYSGSLFALLFVAVGLGFELPA
ncbi:MAG: hypothetical protein V7717_04910 [Porticoccaceae bacterium]